MQQHPFLNLVKLFIVGGTVLMFSACEATTADPAAGSNGHPALVNACSLLTTSEVEIIFRKPVLTTKLDTSSGYITHCVYSGSVDTGFFLPTRLDLTVMTTAGLQGHLGATQTVPAYFASLKTMLTPANEQPVAGIGNDAFWYTKSGKMYFYKGDVSVDIMYRPHGTPIVDTSTEARTGSILAAQGAAAKL